MTRPELGAARARTDAKLRYAAVHLDGLNLTDRGESETDRANAESYLFQLLGVRDALLQEINIYHSCGLPLKKVTRERLEKALKAAGASSPALHALGSLEDDTSSWIGCAAEMRDHAMHRMDVPRTYHVGGDDDGAVFLADPRTGRNVEQHYPALFRTWLAEMGSLVQRLRSLMCKAGAREATNQLVAKLWSYCHVLRDDGLSYQDYLEQLTFLLFLKMADEREAQGKPNPVPEGYRWHDLAAPQMEGARLEDHYRKTLEDLGKRGGMLGLVFRKAQNKIQDPAKLRQLIVELIGKEEWLSLTADVKGDAYEGLLERNAQDVKSGAGQYFTPRPLIDGLIDCIQPRMDETVCDPACGTGGFLLSAYHYIVRHNPDLDRDQKKHLKYNALRGVELVDGVSRLCAMNLLLHGVGPDGDEAAPPIRTDDSLRNEPSEHYPVVVTNPPFGKKSSITVVNDEGETDKHTISYSRPDFWTTTTNKQLNFVQHIRNLLEINGRAAVVVPDNVLFEGGAGETVRRKLMETCDLHTILRLPTGIFYAQGVKANVIFFDRKPASETPWTKTVWFYDLRTNMHFTLKQNRLERSALDEFVACYNGGDLSAANKRQAGLSASDKAQAGRHNRAATWTPEAPEGRWRPYTHDEIIQRDKASLDIFWLRDESLEDSANLPDPDVLAAEIIEDLQAALEELQAISDDLAQTPGRERNVDD